MALTNGTKLPLAAIPCLFLRGGSSRGPYFNRVDPPEDRDQLAGLPIAAVGAGHPMNIDGVGGGAAVTTKIAQVTVNERSVDFGPTRGNILAGAPARRRSKWT
jgi:2-methylaconitate cis-trans-isomerase PrpF